MEEYSRILIEDYCMEHGDTKKSKFLGKMVRLSYDVACEPTDSDAMQLEKYISQEKDPELKEALEDLDEFLFG